MFLFPEYSCSRIIKMAEKKSRGLAAAFTANGSGEAAFVAAVVSVAVASDVGRWKRRRRAEPTTHRRNAVATAKRFPVRKIPIENKWK
jgi:hypothetical protein